MKDTIRAEWWKGLPNSIFIDFLCNWHSISVCLQASARENGQPCTQSFLVSEFNNKKKSSKWTPFLPHCSSLSPSSFCFLCVSLLPSPLPNALYPSFKIEACMVDITICGKPVFTGCHIDDFRKRKKIAHFTFQVGLNLIGTKAQYFSRKKKPKPKQNITWGCHVLQCITRVWCQEALCSPLGLPGDGRRGVTSLSAGQLPLTSAAETGPVRLLDMDFTAHGSWGWPCNFSRVPWQEILYRASLAAGMKGFYGPKLPLRGLGAKKECSTLTRSIVSDIINCWIWFCGTDLLTISRCDTLVCVPRNEETVRHCTRKTHHCANS